MRLHLQVKIFFAITLIWLIFVGSFFFATHLLKTDITSYGNFLIALVIVLSTLLLFTFSWLLYFFLPKYSVSLNNDSQLSNAISDQQVHAISQFILNKSNITNKKYHYFYDDIDKLLSDARRHQKTSAMLTVQMHIKHKKLNKKVNHIYEKIVSQLDDKVSTLLRVTDVTMHIERNTLVILLTDIKHPKFAASIAEKILQQCELLVETLENHHVVNTNIGISIFPIDAESAQELHKKSQIALYKAKQSDAWSYYFYKDDLNKIAQEHIKLKKALQQAIKNKQLTLYYQPQLSLHTGQVHRVEALVRLADPIVGNISPSVLIPLAEEIGLFSEIGNWVIKEACRRCKEWQNKGYKPVSICVNISHNQFFNEGLIDTIKNALKETGLEPAYLEVEIMETVIMNDISFAIDKLTEIHELGVQIAIDDFGTGYTSINYLKRLPVSVLKIDKSFIQELPHNKHDVAITKAMISLSHNLGIEVVAEGVEHDDQLKFLKKVHCDLIQGYMFSTPITDKDLMKFLMKR